MIIRPGKHMTQQLIALFICIVAGAIVLSLYGWSELGNCWIGIIVFFITSLILIPYAVASARTFILDEAGCTVYFLWYCKHYKWDELQLKQYVTFDNIFHYASRSPCVKVAEFAPKKFSIPKKMDSHSFSCFRHPISFIFVQFTPSNKWRETLTESTQIMNPIVYEADEEVFRKKMKEWGVEMTETTRGPWV